MEFLNIYAFLLLLIIPFLFYVKTSKFPISRQTAEKIIIKGKISKKTKFIILLFAYFFMVAALSRPVIENGYTTIKTSDENIVIALDISSGMDAKDLYPDRERFAVNKIRLLLKNLKHQNAALILFDQHSYLISPPTKDYGSIIYLLSHTNLKDLKRSISPNIANALTAASKLAKNSKIVLFTWGGENSLQKAEEIIKHKKLKIYIYKCATEKGDVNGEPVGANPLLNTLTPYVFNPEYSNTDIQKLAKLLNKSKEKTIKIKDETELFYYPLGLSLLLFLFVLFFPFRRNR